MNGRGRRATAGSTLLEMLIVLMILVLAASIAGPGFSTRKRGAEVETVGESMIASLSAARIRAVVTGRPVEVLLEPAVGTATFEAGEVFQVPEGVELTVVTGRETVVGEGRAVLVFLPNGSSTGAEILLTAGSETFRFKVHWLTGLVIDRSPS